MVENVPEGRDRLSPQTDGSGKILWALRDSKQVWRLIALKSHWEGFICRIKSDIDEREEIWSATGYYFYNYFYMGLDSTTGGWS